MKFLFIEDFPHNSDSEDGFLSYEFAKKFDEHEVYLIPTNYKKISNHLLDNFNLYYNINLIPFKSIDLIIIDQGAIGSINSILERKIDSSSIPVITFSEINSIDSMTQNFIFHINHISNCNIDKLNHEFHKWQNQLTQLTK